MVEHLMVAITLPDIFHYKREVSGSRCRRKLETQSRIIHLVNFDGNYLFKLFDAALYLDRLRGLIPEPFDEILYVCYLLLLVFVCPHLLGHTFAPEFEKIAVIDFIVVGLAAGYFYGPARHIVKKSAVVAYQDHSPCLCLHELLKPLYRLYVEMVGGLVKQEDIGTSEQYFGKFHAHAPAARKLTCRSVEIFPPESESRQCRLHFGIDVRGPLDGKPFVDEVKSFNQFTIVLAFIIFAFGQPVGDVRQFTVQIEQTGKRLACLFDQRGVVRQIHLLRKIPHCYVSRHRHKAGRWIFLAGEYFEQCGFTGTVLSCQSYLVGLVDDKTNVCEKRTGREFHRYVVKRNHIAKLRKKIHASRQKQYFYQDMTDNIKKMSIFVAKYVRK